MGVRGCFYCGSIQSRSSYIVNNYRLDICANCGLTYTVLPKNHNIRIFNSKHYSQEYLENYDDRENKLLPRFKKRVLEIDRYSSGGKILDIGCSTGMFINAVRKYSIRKWKYYGIDINDRSISAAAKKIPEGTFIKGVVSKVRLAKNSFDVITCFDVLEHDPLLPISLRTIHGLLKPGGLLIIQNPNYRSVMAVLCDDNWDWWSLPDHVIHFEPRVLRTILMENGFSITEQKTWNDPEDFAMNVVGTIKLKLPRYLYLNKVLARIAWYPSIILGYMVNLIGDPIHIGGLNQVSAVKI